MRVHIHRNTYCMHACTLADRQVHKHMEIHTRTVLRKSCHHNTQCLIKHKYQLIYTHTLTQTICFEFRMPNFRITYTQTKHAHTRYIRILKPPTSFTHTHTHTQSMRRESRRNPRRHLHGVVQICPRESRRERLYHQLGLALCKIHHT